MTWWNVSTYTCAFDFISYGYSSVVFDGLGGYLVISLLVKLQMKEFLSGEKLLRKKPSYYRTNETPDLWFPPELVWEIRGAGMLVFQCHLNLIQSKLHVCLKDWLVVNLTIPDLTISPVHHAAVGLVHPSRGISVRLPRYIRSRPDKTPEDCSTSSDIALMYKSQTRKMEVFRED